ncbi:MAG: 30S ribosome-binding factor RbfA [Bdellovibrionales bacterium]
MKSHRGEKGPSQRQLRVGEQVKQIIAETLMRGHFHHEALLDADITVGEVRVTPDLRNARAYVMSLGGKDIDAIIPALNEETQQFSKAINKQSNMKFTPKVIFVKDDSFEEAQRIDALLRSVHIPDDDEAQED